VEQGKIAPARRRRGALEMFVLFATSFTVASHMTVPIRHNWHCQISLRYIGHGLLRRLTRILS